MSKSHALQVAYLLNRYGCKEIPLKEGLSEQWISIQDWDGLVFHSPAQHNLELLETHIKWHFAAHPPVKHEKTS